MESDTFRNWLVEQGCRFDHFEHQHRHRGPITITVHREGRKTELPLSGHKDVDPRAARRVCDELGLDWSQLPGPKSRV